MDGYGKYASLLAGLDLDAAHFPHGTVEQFVDGLIREFRFSVASVRPLLMCQAMVRAHANESFRIAVSGEPAEESDNALNADSRGIETVTTVRSIHEAVAIVSDLRKYFLRHYPGRCHRNTGESNFSGYRSDVAYVYIAFFDKSQRPPRDGF